MRMRCQYWGQTGSQINCTNDKWYIYVRVMVYALFPVCGVFFVKLTSIYKWRACYNQILKHISASDQKKFAFKYLLYLSVICKNSFVLTLTHISDVLFLCSVAMKKTYHDHPEFSTFTIDLLVDIDHRP